MKRLFIFFISIFITAVTLYGFNFSPDLAGNNKSILYSSPNYIPAALSSQNPAAAILYSIFYGAGTNFSEVNAIIPKAPSNFAFGTKTDNSLDMSWTDNASDEDGFRVYQATDSLGPFINISGDLPPGIGSGLTLYYSAINLLPNIHYYYQVVAFSYLSGESTPAAGNTNTLAKVPGAPVLSNPGLTTMKVTLTPLTNPASTQFVVRAVAHSTTQYLQLNGTLSGTAAWGTYAQFGGAGGIVATGLTPLTSYTFDVKARSGDSIETSYGTPAALSTLGPLAGDFTVGLSMFNKVTGRNIYYETKIEKETIEVPVYALVKNENSEKQEEEIIGFEKKVVDKQIAIPMENGREVNEPLYYYENNNNSPLAGVYPTITAAMQDLMLRGASAPVRFLLLDASYTTGETFPITLNPFAGASGTNTVTIRPQTGVTSAITGSSSSAIFVLNGADYVIIDGSNSGVTDRSLTITNTNTGTSSACVWMQSNASDGAANNTVKNCNIIGNGNTQTLFGIGAGSSTISTSSLGTGNDNNTILNNNISKTQYGIYTQGASAANKNTGNVINNNLINTASPNNISIGGIWIGFCNNTIISGNKIDGITNTGSTDVFGITLGMPTFSTATPSGNEVTNAIVSGNFIGKVTHTAGRSAAGISVAPAATGTNLIYNNSIYGVGTNATDGDFGAGILLGGGIGSTTNIYYNSVSMTGTFSGGTLAYPNYGIAINGSTGSDPVVNIKDNIFYNTLTNDAGTSYAIGTKSTTFANLTSNYNDFYVAAGNFAIGHTGSLAQNFGTNRVLLSDWQTATGKDFNSTSANPLFNSLTNLQPQTGSPVLGAGTPVAGITTDILGVARNGSAPSLGAYENVIDEAPPVISYTILGNTSLTANRTLSSVTITDATGINWTSAPRIYYKKSTNNNVFGGNTSTDNGWKWSVANVGTSPTNFTINYSILFGSPVAQGDIIQYFVVAQDILPTPNVGANPSAGFVGTTVSSITSAPTTPNSYQITQAISGTKTVGTGGNYPSLTGAGGLFADINAKVVTGNITVNIIGNLTEDGTNALNQWSEDPAGSNFTLTIRPDAAIVRTITGSYSGRGLIRLNGADRVTIDGRFDGTGNYLTFSNSSSSGSAVFQLISLGTGAGAANNTIKYCNINTGSNSSGIYGISIGGANPGTAGDDNDNTTIQNNNISKSYVGIYAKATTAGPLNNLQISDNSIGSSIADSYIGHDGIIVEYATGCAISNNNIYNIFINSATPAGITISTGVTNSNISKNKIDNIAYTGSFGSGGRGIYVNTGNPSSNLTFDNNAISRIGGDGNTGLNSSPVGMYFDGNTGGLKIYYNSIYMSGDLTNNLATLSTAILLNTGITGVDIRDNIFRNSMNNTAIGSKNYAIYCATASSNLININYNDYYVSGPGGVLGFISGSDKITLPAWQTATAQDANSKNVDPQFVSARNLQPKSGSQILSAGTPISGITTDILGVTRNVTTPSLGSYENGYAAVQMSGNYIISAVMFEKLSGIKIDWVTKTRKMKTLVPVAGKNTRDDKEAVIKNSANLKYEMREVEREVKVPMVNGKEYTGKLCYEFKNASDTKDITTETQTGNNFTENTNPMAPNAVYVTIDGAINDLNDRGVSGPVNFLLGDASYPSETFPLIINNISGTNSTNTVTIKPNTGVTSSISGSSSVAIFVLNGADYITFDGSNNGTASQNLTITNTSSGLEVRTISINGINNNYNTIKNCNIKSPYQAVYIASSDNTQIINNDIYGDIMGNNNTSQTGIYLFTGVTNTKIQKNKIHDFWFNGTGGWGCFGIYYNSDAATTTEISNNAIYNIKSDGDQNGYSNADLVPTGIYVSTGGNINIFYNSIYMSGNTLGDSTYRYGMSSCISIAAGITGLDIRNNAFQNSMGNSPGSPGNKTYAVVSYSANTAFTNINYNDYFVNGVSPFIGYLGSDIANLTNWKLATGKDLQSLNVDPKFISTTDLHIQAISPLNNAGTYVPAVLDDIDGNIRSLSTPDIGADEYTTALSLGLTAMFSGQCNGTNMNYSKNVTVELHAATTPYALVESKSVTLDVNGSGNPTYTTAVNGTPYYIVIKSNNGLETWSATPQTFSGSTLSYNFTTANTQAYGNNMLLVGAKWCIISGDINQDGDVDALDRSVCWNERNLIGIYASDLNGDGTVDALDRSICWNNRNLTVQKPALFSSPAREVKKDKKEDKNNTKGTYDLKLDGSNSKKKINTK